MASGRSILLQIRFVAGVIAIMVLTAGCGDEPQNGDPRTDGLADTPAGRAVLARNLAADEILPAAVVDSLLQAERDLPVGRRLGAWARRFLAATDVTYRFGPAAGGYVDQGLLVCDRRHDCVSLMYRCSELARAADRTDAVARAIATRFAGAPLDSLIDAGGHVDYDRPEHLDYSLDMIRSGHWGRDLTPILPGAVADTAGSSRYVPGSFSYLPVAAVPGAGLQEGDIAWLVLDPDHPAGAKLRHDHGLVVGHIGIIVEQEGRPWLIHAASSDLAGWYEGGTVVIVPLVVYLERVEKYCGAIITRLG